MSGPPPFWLVWREDGGSPIRKHRDPLAAERESERLARENPGLRFFVLCPTSSVLKADLQRERFDAVAYDDVPF